MSSVVEFRSVCSATTNTVMKNMVAKKKSDLVKALLDSGQLKYGNDPSYVVQRIPTGIPDLDSILKGGIPRKRISILTGEHSAGKSFIVQILMKAALEQGLSVAYIDTERTYDPDWWREVGLDSEKILLSQPFTGEEACDIILALAQSGVDVIALDSLAAMVPTEEAAEGASQKFIGLQARLINKFMRMLLATPHNSAIVCTNQLRDLIGPGPIDSMPGGWGQLFWSSLILRMKREGWIDEDGRHIGFNMRIICRKNKVGTPFGECTLPFLFRGHFDFLSLLMDRAIEAGIIRQAGPYYYLPDQEKAVLGRAPILEALADEAFRKRIETILGEGV